MRNNSSLPMSGAVGGIKLIKVKHTFNYGSPGGRGLSRDYQYSMVAETITDTRKLIKECTDIMIAVDIYTGEGSNDKHQYGIPKYVVREWLKGKPGNVPYSAYDPKVQMDVYEYDKQDYKGGSYQRPSYRPLYLHYQ